MYSSEGEIEILILLGKELDTLYEKQVYIILYAQ